jgi:hypothetical protein
MPRRGQHRRGDRRDRLRAEADRHERHVGGGIGSKTNSSAITFAAITAGSATVIGWALCDALTVGNVLAWGTATSTVISATQTPPTIAIGALVVSLD